jgi:membrane-associated phospholipid phosphatase
MTPRFASNIVCWRALATATALAVSVPVTVARADGDEAKTPAPAPLAPVKKDAKEPARPFEWDPKWPKVQTYEYVLTGVYAVTALGAVAIPGAPRWTSTNGLDDAARGALRLPDTEDQQRARDASDVGIALLINQVLVDNLFVAWWARQHPNVAWQLMVIDAETLAFTSSVQSLVAGLAGRQRPYVSAICGLPENADLSDCNGSNRYRSYFSGHTTAAFTLAGLTCIHHAELPLYGHVVADVMGCAGAMATATTVGFMRVLGDQHYLTDVITGAAFGTLAGIGMPWLLHYRGSPKLDATPKKAGDAPPPMFIATPGGAYLMGAF